MGLNPSLTEFNIDRPWPSLLTPTELASRCRDYFQPHAPCQPHAWFRPWYDGLARLGRSYEKGSAVHLDLSPRATRSVSSLSSVEQKLFLEMVERDLWIFFATLQLCRNARLILMAGSVTSEYYMIEFLQRFAPEYGYTLDRPFLRHAHPGAGIASWHCLHGPDRQIPVFYCSSSPSAYRGTLLPQRIEENALSLKKLVAGGDCSSLPVS